MKKRFLSVVLCLCLVIGMAPSMIQTAQAASNPYPYWQTFTYNGSQYTTITCTYYAWQQVYDRHGIALPVWGNAGSWLTNAQSSGYQTGTEARSGSLAVWRPSASNSWGHVAYVTSASGGSFTYNEGGTANRRANSLGIYEGHTQPDGYTSWPDGFIYLTSPQPTVTFSSWSKNGYTYTRETDASIGQLITVSNGNCTETGMELYNANGQKVASGKNSSYDPALPQIYFKINEECGYTLTPGTTYKYKFYAVVNGQTHWGNEGSFKTNGTAPQPTPQPTTPPSPNLPANATAEAEVNDTIERANKIAVNTEIAGSISKSSDVDWYVFQVPNDGHISITFEHDFVNSSGSYWKTAFYTSENKELNSWTWKGNATSAETGNENGVSAGTYYLRVSRGSYSSSAAYRFTVNYTPSNSWEKEFNETIVTANRIPTGAEISGSIRTSSDADWYQFELPQDGAISITFDHDFVNSSSPYWRTAFYTSENKELNYWTWKGNATSASTSNKNGVSAGTYYLCVKGSTYNSSATYRFTVNYAPSNNWEKEFNETIVTANRISTDTEISGSIRNSSDVDWYQFELPQDGMISLTFGHDFVNSSSSYWKTAFYTSDNKELGSSTWKGNTTSAGDSNKLGLSAGTYYLCVKGSTYNSSATYRFTVNYGSPSGGDEQNPVAVNRIALNKNSISLTPGSSSTLTAQITPSNATDKTIVWRSENTAVATVAGGKVTAVGAGSTRVTASCGGVTASCTVSVTSQGNQPQTGEVHFERVNTYFQDQFTDVPANQWYTDNVAEAFEFGLMKGDSGTTFNPYGDVEISEAVTMAARIHSIFTRGYEDFQQTGDQWYQVYMDYAYENGIISLAYYNCDATQKASRAQFAEIFANSMPAEGLTAINHVADGAIPDVGMGNRYAKYIYTLYRAGILAGNDANGTFNPSTYITRAEAAAIVSRMAESNNRVSITLG